MPIARCPIGISAYSEMEASRPAGLPAAVMTSPLLSKRPRPIFCWLWARLMIESPWKTSCRRSWTILGDYVTRLKEGRVETQELVITRRLTRKLEEYRVKTPSAMALEQFESVGLTIHPGQKVGYLLRDEAISGEEGRILPAPFLEGGEDYDKKKYLEILLKAAAEVLVTFGLDYKDLAKRYQPAK